MRKTKIVCTIGPASDSKDMIEKLIQTGMNVARLNFSHGSHEEHQVRIDIIKAAREKYNVPIAIMLDTKGPEVRLGCFKNGKAELVTGQKIILTTEEILGDESIVSITYKELPNEAEIGTRILVADGLLEFRVIEKREKEVVCEVIYGGTIGDKKNVNIPGAVSKLPALTDKDVADLIFGVANDVDFVAASFIRRPEDIVEIRKVLESNGSKGIQIIAKIESQQGVDNIDEILKVADGIMVARGDLGVEIPTEEMPLVQKSLIKKCNTVGKPVITATQMLESMVRNPRPTRAEVTDIANAIFDGTDAIMLSAETASGAFPIESVRTMATIAQKTESALDYRKIMTQTQKYEKINITNAISHASCTTAYDLEAAAIITPTKSGITPRMISRYRPKTPIIAATSEDRVKRQLSLSFGIYSMTVAEQENTDDLIEKSVACAIECGYVKSGELVVITAGIPAGVTGNTNMIKVHMVGEVIAKGTGIGENSITGEVCIIKDVIKDINKIREGQIMVADYTNNDMLPAMEKAAAFVVSEGGMASHAAIVGMVMKKPVIVGIKHATDMLKDNQTITLDTARGMIYSGTARVF